MTTPEFGRLERVDLREGWESEPQDFTPWLAQPENLAVLSDTLGIELATEGTEQEVGSFRADILCRDTQDDTLVLIENQLERTDHNHLGQLLTYAAGLQTVTIVWVAATFTDEHRAALDWLNEITDGRFRFFGLEIELWRIGNSPPAPKFNIAAKPNDWARTVLRAASGEVSPRDLQHQRFWASLRQHLEEEKVGVRLGTPPARHWFSYGLGKTGFHLEAVRSTQQKQISVEIRLVDKQHSKAHYGLLEQQKAAIESEIKHSLTWREQPNTTVSRITLSQDFDPADEQSWSGQVKWFAETLKKFDLAFRERAQNLDPEDWVSSSDESDEPIDI